MIYWLVMYIVAGTSSSVLHVGNYRSMDDCLAAAHRVQYPRRRRASRNMLASKPTAAVPSLHHTEPL
jgi:hypothetical protein